MNVEGHADAAVSRIAVAIGELARARGFLERCAEEEMGGPGS
jgi:hypothetical protein